MNSREILPNSGYDEDTYRILDISLEFLVRFFGHTEAEAKGLIKQFHSAYSEYYDEDMIHHDWSYIVAATVHYLVFLKGSMENLGDWLAQEGHNNPPREAFEYFREHYFVK